MALISECHTNRLERTEVDEAERWTLAMGVDVRLMWSMRPSECYDHSRVDLFRAPFQEALLFDPGAEKLVSTPLHLGAMFPKALELFISSLGEQLFASVFLASL